MTRFTSLLAGLCILVAAGPVLHAQPSLKDRYTPQEWTKAQELFGEGLALFDAGNYAEACARFEASFRVVRGLGTRGKLAECYEKVGQYAQAWTLYRQVAELGGDDHRGDIATRRAEALEEQIALVSIEAGRDDVRDRRVQIDGRRIGPEELSAPIPLDPGVYELTVSSRRQRVWMLPLDLVGGDRKVVRLPALDEDAAARKPSDVRRIAGLASLGVGAAAVVAGGVFALRSRSQWNQAFDDGACDRDTLVCTRRDAYDLTDAARGNARIADVLVAAGLLAAAAGGYLWWTSRSESTERTKTDWILTNDSISLVVRGSF